MFDIAVVGEQKFILGFQLTGIRHTFEINDDPYKKLKEIMSMENIGIIITEESILSKLEEHDRNEIESSVKPVVIVISEGASSDSLRKMIRKSIGIDLWSSEDNN